MLVAATDHPVRNRDLMATLRRHLTGRHATSKVLRENGFDWQFATLDAALTDLVG
ncbi:MAG: uncharacterized protein QOG79_4302 [Mycobacterium sp.]|nr:uncharacterized protein [Mycobacterium sp.]MDT5287107.1 uncharacterized protein [Mycobacterium sp.]MDT5301060.1 uncharacterized protein [Mycobacterium sp.]